MQYKKRENNNNNKKKTWWSMNIEDIKNGGDYKWKLREERVDYEQEVGGREKDI